MSTILFIIAAIVAGIDMFGVAARIKLLSLAVALVAAGLAIGPAMSYFR